MLYYIGDHTIDFRNHTKSNYFLTLIGSITVDTAGDKFFLIAYDDATSSGDAGAYIYHVNSAAVISDTSATVNEVKLIAFIDGVADDAFAQNAVNATVDLTDFDSAY